MTTWLDEMQSLAAREYCVLALLAVIGIEDESPQFSIKTTPKVGKFAETRPKGDSCCRTQTHSWKQTTEV